MSETASGPSSSPASAELMDIYDGDMGLMLVVANLTGTIAVGDQVRPNRFPVRIKGIQKTTGWPIPDFRPLDTVCLHCDAGSMDDFRGMVGSRIDFVRDA